MAQGAVECDYVIAAAGSAGCVRAIRMTEDPDMRVLILEAGSRDLNPFNRVTREPRRTPISIMTPCPAFYPTALAQGPGARSGPQIWQGQDDAGRKKSQPADQTPERLT